jgi:hypothetical protein
MWHDADLAEFLQSGSSPMAMRRAVPLPMLMTASTDLGGSAARHRVSEIAGVGVAQGS